MKKYFFLLIILVLSNFCFSQTTLYNNDGISLSYTQQTLRSFFCNKANKKIYYTKLRFTIRNNSGKSAEVTVLVNMPNIVSDAWGYCNSDNDIFNNTNFLNSSLNRIMNPGSQNFLEIWQWDYTQNIGTPGFSVNYEFEKPRQEGIPIKIDIYKPSLAPKKIDEYTVKVDQDDYRLNPKDPAKLTNIKDQQALEKQAHQNVLNAENQNKSVQQKQVALDNERRLDDYNKQQETLKQQQALQAQQRDAAEEKMNQLLTEQKQRYEQTQIEFSNARSAADNAYQSAIARGRKESGAMFDATLAGAGQISDPKSSLIYTGVGLAISFFMNRSEKKQERSEKKQERIEKEAEQKREEDQKKLIIEAKRKFITDVLNINKYNFTDLIAKERYASILFIPAEYTAEDQKLYFSIPIQIPVYSDGTYPLKDGIEKKFQSSIDKSLASGTNIYILYPIVDVNNFQNEFTKKMGSGHLLNLKIELLNFTKYPFYEKNNLIGNDETDFWSNPIKNKDKPKQKEGQIKKENDFWNN